VLRVVAGDATPEEVVALVAALAAAASRRAGSPPPPARSRWADREALLGLAPSPAPGAWRAAAWRR
jgi:hypothetical protein